MCNTTLAGVQGIGLNRKCAAEARIYLVGSLSAKFVYGVCSKIGPGLWMGRHGNWLWSGHGMTHRGSTVYPLLGRQLSRLILLNWFTCRGVYDAKQRDEGEACVGIRFVLGTAPSHFSTPPHHQIKMARWPKTDK